VVVMVFSMWLVGSARVFVVAIVFLCNQVVANVCCVVTR